MESKYEQSKRLYTIEDLENILEHIPYEVWMKDKEGRYVYINKRGADKIGLKKEEVIGKLDKEIRPEEFCEKCEYTDRKVFEERREIFYDHEYYSDKDEYYRIYKFPIKSDEDEVRFISALSNESSYSKNINEELEKLYMSNVNEIEDIEYTQSLERIIKNLEDMTKCTSINLFLIDENRDSLKYCLSCDSNLFYQGANISIDNESFSNLYNEKLEIDIDDNLNDKFKEKYSDKFKLHCEGRIKIFPLKFKENIIGVMYLYYEDNRRCIGVYDGIISDICSKIGSLVTNIKFRRKIKKHLYKYEENVKYLQNEHKKLEEAIASEVMKVNFLENMSHEFRTPINIILMTSKLLLSSIEDNKINLDKEKTIKYLKILKQNGYRILRLVNNILDTTKFDYGYEILNMDNYNIINIIEEMVLSTADYIKDNNKNIIFDTQEEEVILSCNPDAIEKIILNLISNSLKFTDENGEIEVDIKVNHEEEKLFVHVRNNGPNISEEYSKKIFDRFVQTDNHLRRENEGSGIGLYLVKCLVEMHGGEIWINTDNEIGAEFIFYIPIKKIDNNGETKIHYIEEHSRIDKCNIEFSDVYSI